MKKKLLIGMIIASLSSCYIKPKPDKPVIEESRLELTKLTNHLSSGLYEIKIDDSITVILYKGVESCTMIQSR